MNIGEIAERLIQAAEIAEHSTVHAVGPAKAKSLPLPYAHDWTDKNGWGAERLKEEEAEFKESVARQPSAVQVSEAEEAMGWYAHIHTDENRAALAAWVRCMADPRRRYFKDWCKKNRIHPETGRRRKERALEEIEAYLGGWIVQHDEIEDEGVLLHSPDFGDIPATGEGVRERRGKIEGWSSEDALQPFQVHHEVINDNIAIASIPTRPADFAWAKTRNERRRQRDAAKRKRAADQVAA